MVAMNAIREKYSLYKGRNIVHNITKEGETTHE